ncbi:hypothetical protein CQ022_18905 [Chryseobacterium culicis]|uniref:Uncharacterized protein n=1 Tax=Chryseobacterium culicis TaxID=680127 RepID=A0A2S9CML3_CHRCI|nr:hypothetical protein CQ022_18905 [Chryseobacterium culicis]PRB88400.1 hypothetical protein CQ033_17810 [Chryseobacterium culicis]
MFLNLKLNKKVNMEQIFIIQRGVKFKLSFDFCTFKIKILRYSFNLGKINSEKRFRYNED